MKAIVVATGWCVLVACAGHTSVEPPSGGINGSVVLSSEIAGFLLDDARLYWFDRLGNLRSRLKQGSAMLNYGQAGYGVALGADQIFWTTKRFPSALVTCPKSGCVGSSSVVSKEWDYGGNLYGDGDYVYWSTSDRISRCPFSGCVATPELVAAEGTTGALTFSGNDLYWVSSGGAQSTATPRVPPQIRRAPKDGSQPAMTVVTSLGGSAAIDNYPPNSVAVNGASVYWIGDSNHIVSCPVAGCGDFAPQQVVSSNDEKEGLQVDATGLYWQQSDLGNKFSVRYCPLTGCGTNSLILTANNVHAFALDATDVYWTEAGPGGDLPQTVRRVAKPAP